MSRLYVLRNPNQSPPPEGKGDFSRAPEPHFIDPDALFPDSPPRPQPVGRGCGGEARRACPSAINHRNSPDFSITTSVGASLLRVILPSRNGEKLEPEEGGDLEDETEDGKRAEITDFSQKSRRNFRDDMAAILTEARRTAVLTTLTYPAEFPDASDRIVKTHLEQLNKRMVRLVFDCSGHWKMEFQARGAVHFHCILYGLTEEKMVAAFPPSPAALRKWEKAIKAGKITPGLVGFQEWTAKAWFEIVGSGDEKHLRAGVRVERVKDPTSALWYMSSYASKDDQTKPGFRVGRYWGSFNKKHLPVAPVEVDQLSQRQAVVVARCLRKHRVASMKAAAIRKALKVCPLAKSFSPNLLPFLHQGKRTLEHHKGGELVEVPNDRGGYMKVIRLPSVQWVDASEVPLDFKWPKKPRLRYGQSITVYCDASGLRKQLLAYASTIAEQPRKPSRIERAMSKYRTKSKRNHESKIIHEVKAKGIGASREGHREGPADYRSDVPFALQTREGLSRQSN